MSFNFDGDLDMRLGINDFSAKDVVNKLDSKDLEKIFKFFGEESESKKIAKSIIIEREKKKLTQKH